MGVSWPLVGRGAELARFGEALSAPQTSGAVFVGGAGVGKTRLGKEALALAEAMGWAVRWATATRSAASIPFSALADVLSGVRMDGANRFELLRRMVATLVTASGGLRLVLGVDDGHLSTTHRARSFISLPPRSVRSSS